MLSSFGQRSLIQSNRPLLILSITSSVMLCLSLALGVYVMLYDGASETKPEGHGRALDPVTTVDVLVPKETVRGHTLIDPNSFETVAIPIQFFRKGMIQDSEQLISHYAKMDLQAQLPVMIEQLSAQTSERDIRSAISANYRAVTIKADKVVGIDEWVQPGARVDIASISQINNEPAIIPLVSNIEVLSVDHQVHPGTSSPQEPPKSITLLAGIKEVPLIQLAQQTGYLSVAIRGAEIDPSPPEKTIITKSDIGPTKAKQNSEEDLYDGSYVFEGQKYLIRGDRITPSSHKSAYE